MKSQIVLIRHGITTGNEQRLYYGSSDIPLADRGREELKKLAAEGIYPQSSTAEYYTSGMLRTEETLQLIYGDRPHETIDKLKELNFGEFEMKKYEELMERPEYRDWIETKDDALPPPGGESIRAFAERVTEGFEELKVKHELLMLKLRNREQDAMSICVCHGGVISAIMSCLWPGKYDNFYAWIPDPGHGYILTMEDGAVKDAEKF